MNLYGVEAGPLIELGVQLNAALGYAAYSKEVFNSAYDAEQAAKYDWYARRDDEPQRPQLQPRRGDRRPPHALGEGEVGLVAGVHYPLILSEEITQRLSARFGLSFAFDPPP